MDRRVTSSDTAPPSDTLPPGPPVATGEVIAGKFRVLRTLGLGGMGTVVAAHHIDLDQTVALKFIHAHLLRQPASVRRLLREARAAARLRGPHVGRVLDVARLHDGSPFIVMEYLEGHDLGAILRHGGPLPVEVAVDYMLQTCAALAEAHAASIVHRDIKPENLFLTSGPGGRIKVLDFGISKLDDAAGQTGPASVMGSPAYMSPEQMCSPHHVDARSDIWSVGVVLHELLSGRAPFLGESLPATAMRIVHDTPVPLRSVRPEVPAALDEIVARCLAKDPDARFPSVAALIDALRPFASGTGATPVPPPRRRRAPLIAAGAAALVVAAAGAIALVGRAPAAEAPVVLPDAAPAAKAKAEAVAPPAPTPDAGLPPPPPVPAAVPDAGAAEESHLHRHRPRPPAPRSKRPPRDAGPPEDDFGPRK